MPLAFVENLTSGLGVVLYSVRVQITRHRHRGVLAVLRESDMDSVTNVSPPFPYLTQYGVGPIKAAARSRRKIDEDLRT